MVETLESTEASDLTEQTEEERARLSGVGEGECFGGGLECRDPARGVFSLEVDGRCRDFLPYNP